MSVLRQPKFKIPAEAVAPKGFSGVGGEHPPDDFVVTHKVDGSTASYFGDLIWVFTAYDPDGRACTFNFAYWGNNVATRRQLYLSEEIRYLVFSLIWRRGGKPLSIGTLYNYQVALCALAQYVDSRGHSVKEILCDESMMRPFIFEHCSGWMAETFGSLLKLLSSIDTWRDFQKQVSVKFLQSIRSYSREYRARLKQHPPIPTRIYSHLLASLQQQLQDWLMVADDMLSSIVACAADPRAGRRLQRHRRIANEFNLVQSSQPIFDEVTTVACREYLQRIGKPLDVRGLSAAAGRAQQISKLIIQAYSGMRDDEAGTLPYNAIDYVVSNGRRHILLRGRTTKLNSGLVKRATWVTCKEAEQAVEAAQTIANTVYSKFGLQKSDIAAPGCSYPLFVSVAFMHLSGRQVIPPDKGFVPCKLNHHAIPDKCLALIDEADIVELERIDPHRAWRADAKFEVGKRWTFTSHQLRRSLALYAQRSGLVSLPSLRRQLQHITEEMSRYYAKGSLLAKDILDDDKTHFGFEWQLAQPESAALSYIENVLNSREPQFGGHVAWLERRMQLGEATVIFNRDDTMKRFRKGEIAYRDTLLGGCVSTEGCAKVAVKWLPVDCIRDNCKNLVGSYSKLERVITAQRKMLNAIEIGTVEYRTESDTLNALVKAYQTREAEV